MRANLLLIAYLFVSSLLFAQADDMVIVNTDKEPIEEGKFEPAWESLQQYQIPEWFHNAS
jgi:alpha-L-fucosidase